MVFLSLANHNGQVVVTIHIYLPNSVHIGFDLGNLSSYGQVLRQKDTSCIGYGLSDDDGDVVDADECEREGVKCITLLELGIDIRDEEESAFDPAGVGSELCPEAPLFKAEQLGESGGGGAVIPKELGIERPGSNTGDILADKQLQEEEVPVILDAAAAKETAEVRLRVLLMTMT